MNLSPDSFDENLMDPKLLSELEYLLKDLLAGDTTIDNHPTYRGIKVEQIKAAYDFIMNRKDLSQAQKADLLANSWRLNFRKKPPTPAEFLTTRYLGPTATTIYPHIKQAFLDFMDNTKPYRTAVLYPAIGTGKSFLTVLINLYIGIHLSYMKSPWKFFGQSPATVYTIVFAGTSIKKASELIVEPLSQVLETSDFFEKVQKKETMLKMDSDFMKNPDLFNQDKLYWTTAVPTSVLQFSNGASYKMVSSPNGLLGQTIVAGSMTELSFFSEAGKSDDYVFKFFTKLRGRVESRMKGNYYGRFIIDSSPNTLDSVIDDWIVHDAPKNPENYIMKGSRWKFFPEDFPDMLDENNKPIPEKSFPVYLGGRGKPPAVLPDDYDQQSYEPTDIIWVPNNLLIRGQFEENVFEALKDVAGIPAGTSDKIFYDEYKIERIFEDKLKNMYYCISARAEDNPEKLIWDQLKGEFFIRTVGDRYTFWRLPDVPRVLSVDLAVSGDVASISVAHVERGETAQDVYYVIDFTVVITPHKGRINLDAVRYFIMDLINLGGLNIQHVSFDQFQSESTIQFLKRRGVLVERLSVDRYMEPYLNMVSVIESDRLRMGKNIFVKNNLRSLRIVRRKARSGKEGSKKVEHTDGELVYEGDLSWEKSFVGIHAKDTTDSICANIEMLKKYDFVPIHSWEPEKIVIKNKEEVEKDTNELMASWGMSV